MTFAMTFGGELWNNCDMYVCAHAYSIIGQYTGVKSKETSFIRRENEIVLYLAHFD